MKMPKENIVGIMSAYQGSGPLVYCIFGQTATGEY